MENTVEAILGHGDKDPQILLNNLKTGGNNNATSFDEELARQLSSQVDSGATSSTPADPSPAAAAPAATSNKQRLRGTPTTLPDDFLRVNTSTSQTTLDSDEALARMLQDKLFSEELSRNPDFAHLAGRRPSAHNGQRPQSQAVNRASFTARGHQPMPMPNIMGKLSGTLSRHIFKLSMSNLTETAQLNLVLFD